MSNRDEALQRAAKQHYILNGPPPSTFSATAPAYAGTVLEARPGIRPYGETKKICLRCRKKYSTDGGQELCSCGGRLYAMNTYYQRDLKKG